MATKKTKTEKAIAETPAYYLYDPAGQWWNPATRMWSLAFDAKFALTSKELRSAKTLAAKSACISADPLPAAMAFEIHHLLEKRKGDPDGKQRTYLLVRELGACHAFTLEEFISDLHSDSYGDPRDGQLERMERRLTKMSSLMASILLHGIRGTLSESNLGNILQTNGSRTVLVDRYVYGVVKARERMVYRPTLRSVTQAFDSLCL